MLKKLMKEDGFSLLEIVLSIGILALLSVFVLQMFVVSSQANHRAKDADRASYIAMSAIEELKACNMPNDFLNTYFIVDTQVAFGLSSYFVVEDKLAYTTFDFTRGFSLYKYYDSDWGCIKAEDVVENPNEPTNADTKFILQMDMKPSEANENIAGVLYEVEIHVSSINADGELRELSGFETQAYFANVGEIYGN